VTRMLAALRADLPGKEGWAAGWSGAACRPYPMRRRRLS
jgi:hypothetical protein